MSEHPTPMAPKARVMAYRAMMGAGRPFSGKQMRRIKHKANHAAAPFGAETERRERRAQRGRSGE